MSFRLFIYYCALCGGWAAFFGWGFGELLAPDSDEATGGRKVAIMGIKGMFLGMLVALGLSLVDAVWNLSLKRVGQIALRVGVAVMVGCIAGLIGGLLAQVLYSAFAPFFVIGWTLTGLLVGVSIAVFEIMSAIIAKQNTKGPLRKMVKCLLGGTAGGLLGGILAMILRAGWAGVFSDKDITKLWSPTAMGFVALGMCIGLLVGLAQIILKEAWIKVEAGFRPGREMILSKETTTIGRAEECDIGLFGDPNIEKIHASIVQVGSQYFVEDAQTPAGTYVNGQRVSGRMPLQSNDLIQVGKSSLRFNERQKQQTTTGV